MYHLHRGSDHIQDFDRVEVLSRPSVRSCVRLYTRHGQSGQSRWMPYFFWKCSLTDVSVRPTTISDAECLVKPLTRVVSR
jgi:hypothetical protein